MNSTVHLVHLILCLLLLLESQLISFSRADNWSRGDEQSKTTLRQRKLSYSTPEEETLKMGQTAEQEGGGSRLDEQQHQDGGIIGDHRGYGSSSIESDELDREHEQAVISEQKGSTSNSMLMDSGKSARQSMDNLVKEMRTKAVNSAYADAAQLPMVEQTNNMIEQQQSFSGGRGAEHDHSGTDTSDSNIRIAVKSKRRFEFVPVHFDRDDMRQPRMIEISSDSMPLRLHFKSQSAAIVVTQSHMSRKHSKVGLFCHYLYNIFCSFCFAAPMKAVEETVTMDQPYRISHEVHKPIIQTVKEFIQPYRTVIQTLKPVIEDIRTIVPKDSDVQHQHQGGISGSINQSNRPPFGGISGSMGGRANSGADQWSPTIGMVMPRKGSLKTPPPLSSRPISPGYQLQQQQQHQQQHTGNGRFGNRHSNYDSVKGSESRHRVQRRTQQDVDGFHRVHQRHHRSTPGPTINGNKFRGFVGSTQQSNSPMQFGSSELVYVPMMPDSANNHHHHHHHYDNNNNDDDDSNNNQQQLGDYFAAKSMCG